MQHVFIIGAKGLGNYGGYETFVQRLVELNAGNANMKYCIACKANGVGHMDEDSLKNVRIIDTNDFVYDDALCHKVHVNERLGAAQAIAYDLDSFKWVIQYIQSHHIINPIVYVLACRIGPFFSKYVKDIHQLGGKVFINPDGHEWMRAKWPKPIRYYWKKSEQLMVKHADLVVCDSVNIERYINHIYEKYHPNTTYIAYGADVAPSALADDSPSFTRWLKRNNLQPYQYYYCCGRFVPENNFEIMIREFMKSDTNRDFALITTRNDELLEELDRKLGWRKDKRIKFVGAVYDQQLLKKIREQAYGYFHGHSVGGTNPSLLESLASTNLNLLLDVGFNREVGDDAALYWNKETSNLSILINWVDRFDKETIQKYGKMARERISEAYSWQFIADEYEHLFHSKN